MPAGSASQPDLRSQYISRNPLTPIFGQVPPYYAGRENIIDDMILRLIIHITILIAARSLWALEARAKRPCSRFFPTGQKNAGESASTQPLSPACCKKS